MKKISTLFHTQAKHDTSIPFARDRTTKPKPTRVSGRVGWQLFDTLFFKKDVLY